MKLCLFFLAYFCFSLALWPLAAMSEGEDPYANLLKDLQIVEYWNNRLNDRMPVTYNHLLHGGYFNMPSARMGAEGEVGFGFSYVPPYRNYNLRCQLTDRLEISGNYRVYIDFEDLALGQYGFGDLSDKGANVKFSLFHPEDSDCKLPGLAIGFEDFMGTRAFKSQYVVLTHVFLGYNLEASLGYGGDRIRGFFGGVSWMPFRKSENTFLKGLSIAAEYDATPYKDETVELHPEGHESKTPINLGIKYRLWDQLDLSCAYVRGVAWAFSGSLYYNFGTTKGFLPKINEVPPYQAPVNTQPLGGLRPEYVLVQEMLNALCDQGFDLYEVDLTYNDCGAKVLRMRIFNLSYRLERDVRDHLNNLLAYLVPSDIDFVIVVIDSEGFSIQEYHYNMEYVRLYGEKQMCAHELRILSPMCEVSVPPPCSTTQIFKQHRDWWNIELLPKTHFFFGSAHGKFKYSLGATLALNGFLYDDVYYSVRLGCAFWSSLGELRGIDRLNPSQLLGVRTDIVRYFNQKGVTVDEAFLQKNWNLRKGWYGRLSLGYFEVAYGGVASEVLYYPVNSAWAMGIEAAVLKKRTFSGLGFTDKVRKLDGFRVTHRKFLGTQYFVNLYYDWHAGQLDVRVKAGKFLANDWGARFELCRYFPSGLRVTVWYTLTNANDVINRQRYHDKGIAFSMPLDVFYTYSDRSRWQYGMSAWLRDIGIVADNGISLYDLIREDRVE